MASDSEMRAAGIHLPAGGDYMNLGDDAISANARVLWNRVEGARWNQNGSALRFETVLDDLPNGTYSIWSAAVSDALDMPEVAQWSIDVKRWGAAGGIMLAQTRTDPPRSYMSARLADGWTRWARTDNSADATTHQLPPASPASLKSTPLALTTGYGSATRSGSGTTSVIQHLPAQAGRFQLHMRNWTPRYTTADAAPVTLTGVRIGRHTGGGNGADWVSLPSGATAYESGWINVPEALRGGEVVVRYTWSGSTVRQCLGTGWTDGSSDQRPPLFVWLELEVPASVPVVADYGSSTAVGVGSDRPLIDSWLARWARANGAIPAFWADSGTSALTWMEGADRRWERYGYTINAPDAMLYAMGSNDWAGGFDLTELQRRITATVQEIRARITPNIYGTTITPRATPPANDSTRIALNAWMPGSGLFRDVFDAAAAVSLPDGSFDPAADADGIHPNDVGHQRIAAAITQPITAIPEPQLEAIGYDSGLRNITSLLESPAEWTVPGASAPSPLITVQRMGPSITLTISGMRYYGTATGAVRMFQLPSGLRPPENQYPSNTLGGKGVQVRNNGLVYVYSPGSALDYVTIPFLTREAPPATPPGTPA